MRLLACLALALAACTADGLTTDGGADLARLLAEPLRDGPPPFDSPGGADLAADPDLGEQPDAAVIADLAVSDVAGPPPDVAAPGCGKDTDCKGDRLCVNGACVDPPDLALLLDLSPGPDLAPRPDLIPASDLAPPLDFTAPPDLAPLCVQTLANVGAGDFTIRFVITTAARVLSTVVYQRSICAGSDLWDVRLAANGTLEIATDDLGGHFTLFNTVATVNDGRPHAVVITRVAQVLSARIDGAASGAAASAASWQALPPLGIGKGDPCENGGGSVPLVGAVTNVCLTIP